MERVDRDILRLIFKSGGQFHQHAGRYVYIGKTEVFTMSSKDTVTE